MKKAFSLLALIGLAFAALFAVPAFAALPTLAAVPLDLSGGLADLPMLFMGGILITPAALTALQTAFNAAFKMGMGATKPTWPLIAMQINSTTKTETYGWLKELPGMREWVGQRVINNLESQGASLTNKNYEHTVGVDRNDILDDQLGIYTNALQMQGETVGLHPNELVWGLLPTGFATNGFDGQYFFDTDHVGYTAAGAEISWSNTGGGSGSPWVLADLSRSFMKPLIFQERQKAEFVSLTDPTGRNVFMERQFLYGADARYVAGFGFHQLAYGSKATLDATTFAAGRLAMETQRRPDGSPLPVKPTHLITGPTNRSAAEALLTVQYLAGGANNPYYKAVELVIDPSLG